MGWREKSSNAAAYWGQEDKRPPGSTPPGFTDDEWKKMKREGPRGRGDMPSIAYGQRGGAATKTFDGGSTDVGHGEGTWFGEARHVDMRDINGEIAPKSKTIVNPQATRRATRVDWTNKPKH